jgi:hypothetical protein
MSKPQPQNEVKVIKRETTREGTTITMTVKPKGR